MQHGHLERMGTGTRLEEELSCLRTILQCLDASFRHHSQPLVPGMPLPPTEATSLEETCEFFDLIVSLLAADPNPGRLTSLIFGVQPSLLDTLLTLMETPIPSHQLSNPAYINCRVQCVQTVTKLLSMCSEYKADILAERTLGLLQSKGFVPMALGYLTPVGGSAMAPLEGAEAVRVALAECLFVMVMRTEGAAECVIADGGIPGLFECLFTDSSVMVRNYACAVLRVLAEKRPDQYVSLPLVERALGQIKIEHSKYVVILLLETISLVFRSVPAVYLQRVHDSPAILSDLYSVLQTFLSGNTNQEVLAAVVKVIEAVCLLEGTDRDRHQFITMSLTQEGWKPLLNHANQDCAVRVLKVRALRHIIQACSTRELNEVLHTAFTHFFPAISILLNQAAEAGPTTDVNEQELRCEVALCFSLILAKHPHSRDYVQHTIQAYPVWRGQLRQHLLNCLDSALPPVYNTTFIIDVLPSFLNSIHNHPGVDWGDRRSVAHLANHLFQQQTSQYPSAPPGALPPNFMMYEETAESAPGDISNLEKKARLTHSLLSHVIHTTLHSNQGTGPPLAPPNVLSPAAVSHGVSPLPVTPSPRHAAQNHPYYTDPAGFDAFVSATTAGIDATPPQPQKSFPTMGGRKSPRAGEKEKRFQNLFHSRPPWNSGGSAGRRALFSSPSSGPRRTNFTPGRGGAAPPTSPSLRQKKSARVQAEEDYLDMAILMHLPITFGAHYNRKNRPTKRRFNTEGGVPYVQQTCKPTTMQSWEVRDLQEGDLYSFFIPFHKLSEERLEKELDRLRKHLVKMKKGLLTTPHGQKGRRWFFYDMQHYILPKTEVLLVQLKDLVTVHGTANILFYLNIIRLMEQGKAQKIRDGLEVPDTRKQGLMSPPRDRTAALGGGLLPRPGTIEYDREDLLQEEVLKLSSGKYKDTIHGGNIMHVIEKLKEYFAENYARGDIQLSDHLKDIEHEIRKLEEKAARDVLGNEAQAEAEDDVESEYDSTSTEDAPPPKQPTRGEQGEMDSMGRFAEPDFSTETESDINYNLERLRLTESDSEDEQLWINAGGADTLPSRPQDPNLSPRRPGNHLTEKDLQQMGGLPDAKRADEWSDSSTMSF